MLKDRLVKILGVPFACVDEGFGQNKPVDVSDPSGRYLPSQTG